MKKRILILFAALLGLISCSREPEGVVRTTPQDDASVEGLPVTIEFTIPGFAPSTRALEDCGELHSLHLAVFGGSGYLKEYVQANHVRTEDYTYQMEDKEGNLVPHTVPCYTYTVTLSLAESPRTVHFLGNGPTVLPFGYDTAVLPIQLSGAGEMGYWQKLYLPDGIRAKRNAEGYFIDSDGNVIPEGGRGYIADDDTEAAFQGIPLVRNWAKVVLRAENDPENDVDSFFTPYSFAMVNVPSRGTMVPYSAKTGFITNYQALSFPELEATEYPGNLIVGTTFDSTIPKTEDFQAPLGAGVAEAGTGAAYLYERPEPTDNIPPTYVIVYGHYRNPDDLEHEGDYFYKVDLMETEKEVVAGETIWNSRYYPIYRNFKYQIVIRKVLSQGHATPQAAALSAGSADVSADVTTSHLADLSDGAGRLIVTPWLAHTFSEENGEDHPVDVLHVFFTQQPDGSPDMDPSSVKAELLPAEDGGPDLIYGLSIGAPSEETDNHGWRQVTFCTQAPGRTVRTQVIRITGTHNYGRLYRDVTISVNPIQPMVVTCTRPHITALKGMDQSVVVQIPDGLVESMFPLEFIIEAEDMTLTPDNTAADNNLPVVYGTSISETEGYAGKQAFQFKRTVSWDEYLHLMRHEDENNQTWRTFTCWFKTNRDDNATRVWVYNPFFRKASDRFENTHFKLFQNLSFTTPIPEEENAEITLHFEMVEDTYGVYPEDYPVITVAPGGLRLMGDGFTPGDVPGTYNFKPTGHSVDLTFVTTSNYPDEYSVDLTAEDYTPGHVHTYRFPMAKFLDGHPMSNGQSWKSNAWSNVAWGYINNANGKNVLFGYKDDPDKLNTPVTVTIKNGLNFSKEVNPTGLRSPYADTGYHEIEFTVKGGDADVESTLSSPGYIVETIRTGRFVGNIRTISSLKTKPFATNNSYGFTMAHPTFEFSEDNGKVRVTFSEISAEPNGKIVFQAGGTYTMTVESLISAQTLFYMDMWFQASGATVAAPAAFENISAGEITRYPGSNNQYVWSIPRGQSSASVTFRAPETKDIVLDNLYIKAYNGYLKENGVAIP